jgi:hypothetical protein
MLGCAWWHAWGFWLQLRSLQACNLQLNLLPALQFAQSSPRFKELYLPNVDLAWHHMCVHLIRNAWLCMAASMEALPTAAFLANMQPATQPVVCIAVCVDLTTLQGAVPAKRPAESDQRI